MRDFGVFRAKINGVMGCNINRNISVCSPYRGRFSSVGRAFDCRAEGRGFDSRDRTILRISK